MSISIPYSPLPWRERVRERGIKSSPPKKQEDGFIL